jgi:hypothetical protein
MSKNSKLVVKPMITKFNGKLGTDDFLPINYAETFEFSIYKGNFLKEVFNVNDMFDALDKAREILEKEKMTLNQLSAPNDFYFEVEKNFEMQT